MADATDADVTRRTRLAAERTWLAWWRTGIAASAASVGVGAVVPQLVEGTSWPYVVLGAGYAVLAAVTFIVAGRRQRHVEDELDRGGYAGVDPRWVSVFTAAGTLLAVGTLVAVVGSS
jgi:putative membrane protein